MDWLEHLTASGYALLRDIFSRAEMETACAECAAALQQPAAKTSLLQRGDNAPHGARNLLEIWPGCRDLALDARLTEPLLRALGPQAGIVRSLYFDKPPGDGWALPWHRDSVIAVKQHGSLGYFCHPTTKAGVPHVEAPDEVMATILTARIHLEDMNEGNGPLRVIPASHLAHAAAAPSDREAVTIQCRAGDVLLMRPLLLHASGHCAPGHRGHRRILHLEFAPVPSLPDGYAFHSYIPLQGHAPSSLA